MKKKQQRPPKQQETASNQNTETCEQQDTVPDQKTESPKQLELPIEEKTEINRLLDEGYSVRQIIALGFNRRTAYHYAKERMKPENEPASGENYSGNTDSNKSAGQNGKQDLMKIGSKDLIPPEAVVGVMRFPQDGDSLRVWQEGYISGMWSLLAGARYGQLVAAGQADIISSQMDLWKEAKEGSKDVATEAAHQTAVEIANFIDQKVSKPEPSEDKSPGLAERMIGPMADMAGKQMANMMGSMFGMPPSGQSGQVSEPNVPEGWEYETVKDDEQKGEEQ